MAQVIRNRVFDYQGQKYEVRALAEGSKVFVRVYKHGEPATPFRYSIESDTRYDLTQLHGLDGIDKLIEMAQKDVFAGRVIGSNGS